MESVTKMVDSSSRMIDEAWTKRGFSRGSCFGWRVPAANLHGGSAMRVAMQEQPRLDCPPVDAVPLNRDCRDEIIPILRALQHVYAQVPLRGEILDCIGKDVNCASRPDRGREGLSYWTILVLAAVRLGCNFDYDRLQDLA